MEQLIVVFLLFFAVLAFGWFYWQRAKGRTPDVNTTPVHPAGDTAKSDRPE